MTIIVKYSDTRTKEIDFGMISDKEVTDSFKKAYITRALSTGNKLVELIYPYHTETYTLYKINYRRR